ncbi:MFS transporter [Achromobacter xylosoxidans]
MRRLGPAVGAAGRPVHGTGGHLCAAWAPGFEALLAGRFVQALGLATCSITTQTMLRDRLQGEALTRCFIMLGAVLSWSPALGPLAGQLLADQAGFRGVLGGIAALAGLLLAAGWAQVGETRTAPAARQPMLRLARRMLRDPELLCTAMLVAGLNLLAFSFYAAGPFMTGPLPWLGFGWIGMAVALAGTLGALWNRRLPASQAPRGGWRWACAAWRSAWRRRDWRSGSRPCPASGGPWPRCPSSPATAWPSPTCWGRRCDATATAWAGPARCSAWAITACWGCCWRRRRGCLSARPCRWRWPGRG